MRANRYCNRASGGPPSDDRRARRRGRRKGARISIMARSQRKRSSKRPNT
jgi:hypothetical protein